jgi:hypothetical protein
METFPFRQRIGIDIDKAIEKDFPINARFGLAYIFRDLDSKACLGSRGEILNELFRRARIGTPPNVDYHEDIFKCLIDPLKSLEWDAVFDFCERVYDGFLKPTSPLNENELIELTSLAGVRAYFSNELNLLLSEENIAYQFVEGRFQRRGRAQTQKSIQRMGSILNNPDLCDVRRHFNKARQFFDQKPEPDSPNCIKEALCALEACLSHQYKEDFSSNFDQALKKIQGNELGKIPAPIAGAILKTHAYRGSGQGVAHAALEGARVSAFEAELILNLIASYITYVVDVSFAEDQDVPF